MAAFPMDLYGNFGVDAGLRDAPNWDSDCGVNPDEMFLGAAILPALSRIFGSYNLTPGPSTTTNATVTAAPVMIQLQLRSNPAGGIGADRIQSTLIALLL